MKYSILALILVCFTSVVLKQSVCFAVESQMDSHCASEAHHAQSAGNEAHDHFHAGVCVHSFYISYAETAVSTPEKSANLFSENLFSMKPGPYLDGPLQPPRFA